MGVDTLTDHVSPSVVDLDVRVSGTVVLDEQTEVGASAIRMNGTHKRGSTVPAVPHTHHTKMEGARR
jgi:hypothetical protein